MILAAVTFLIFVLSLIFSMLGLSGAMLYIPLFHWFTPYYQRTSDSQTRMSGKDVVAQVKGNVGLDSKLDLPVTLRFSPELSKKLKKNVLR